MKLNLNNYDKKKFLIDKNIKYFFFDFDGVIVESLNIKTEGFIELYNYLSKKEKVEIADHHIKYSGISRYQKIKYYHKKYLNIDLNKKQLDLECNKFSKIILNKMFKVKYVYGVKKFLKYLNKNCSVYLLSATPQYELERILEFKNWFGNIIIAVCILLLISEHNIKLLFLTLSGSLLCKVYDIVIAS